jgi:hypothetical protein
LAGLGALAAGTLTPLGARLAAADKGASGKAVAGFWISRKAFTTA